MTGSKLFPDGFQGRHMAMCLGAFFGVMLIANGFFLYFAISTFNGLTTDDAYRSGLNYNERVADEKYQKKLGWTSRIAIDGANESLTIRMTGKSGTPIRGLAMEGLLMRPATNRFDIPLEIRERSHGIYEASLKGVEQGNWVISVQIHEHGPEQAELAAKGPKTIYRMKKRIWLTQSK